MIDLMKVPTEWRKIPGIPERFEVSDSGLVRVLARDVTIVHKDGRVSKRHIEGRILSPHIRSNGRSKGHPVVTLAPSANEDFCLGEMRVCLLVARAFHGTPYRPGDLKAQQKWRVRHKDGDITNVAADNLWWSGNSASASLYEANLRRLEELRQEPVEEWIKRMWGEDALSGVA